MKGSSRHCGFWKDPETTETEGLTMPLITCTPLLARGSLHRKSCNLVQSAAIEIQPVNRSHTHTHRCLPNLAQKPQWSSSRHQGPELLNLHFPGSPITLYPLHPTLPYYKQKYSITYPLCIADRGFGLAALAWAFAWPP